MIITQDFKEKTVCQNSGAVNSLTQLKSLASCCREEMKCNCLHNEHLFLSPYPELPTVAIVVWSLCTLDY